VIIGVTGTIGAGKSSFASALVTALSGRGMQVTLIDADKIARDVVGAAGGAVGGAGTAAAEANGRGEAGVVAELVARFGSEIVRPDGTLDRALVASRAFADDASAHALNAIIHPHVIDRTRRIIHDSAGVADHFVLDVPLLFESGMDRLCDHVVTVTAAPEMRRRRAARFVDQEIRERRQWSQERKAAEADTVVENDGSLEELARKAVEISGKLVT
jgi:dephospho-CoA kinase